MSVTDTLVPVSTLPVTQWRDVIHMEAGTQLAVAGWVPQHPRAIALLCHGHAEHPRCYGQIVSPLVDDGLAVNGTDHRSHGRSADIRTLISDIDRGA